VVPSRRAGWSVQRIWRVVLLSQAPLGLGVSLATVLPGERLVTAAHWTDKALRAAERLEAPPFLAHALRMHDDQLRKADRVPRRTHLVRRECRRSVETLAAGPRGQPDLRWCLPRSTRG
jgi:hypothetical protein